MNSLVHFIMRNLSTSTYLCLNKTTRWHGTNWSLKLRSHLLRFYLNAIKRPTSWWRLIKTGRHKELLLYCTRSTFYTSVRGQADSSLRLNQSTAVFGGSLKPTIRPKTAARFKCRQGDFCSWSLVNIDKWIISIVKWFLSTVCEYDTCNRITAIFYTLVSCFRVVNHAVPTVFFA